MARPQTQTTRAQQVVRPTQTSKHQTQKGPLTITRQPKARKTVLQILKQKYPTYNIQTQNGQYIITSPQQTYKLQYKKGQPTIYAQYTPHTLWVNTDGTVTKEITRSTYKSDAGKTHYTRTPYESSVKDYKNNKYYEYGKRELSHGRESVRLTSSTEGGATRTFILRDKLPPTVTVKTDEQKREEKRQQILQDRRTALYDLTTPQNKEAIKQYQKQLRETQHINQYIRHLGWDKPQTTTNPNIIQALTGRQQITPEVQQVDTAQSRNDFNNYINYRAAQYDKLSSQKKGGLKQFIKLTGYAPEVAKEQYKRYQSEVEKAGGTAEYWKQVALTPVHYGQQLLTGLGQETRRIQQLGHKIIGEPTQKLLLGDQKYKTLQQAKAEQQKLLPSRYKDNPELLTPEQKTFWTGTTIIGGGYAGFKLVPTATRLAFRGLTTVETAKAIAKPTPQQVGQAGMLLIPEIVYASSIPDATARTYFYTRTIKKLKKQGASKQTITEFKQEWNRAFNELPREVPITKRTTVGHIQAVKQRLSQTEINHIDALGAKYGIKTIGTSAIPPQTNLKKPADARKTSKKHGNRNKKPKKTR